MKHVLKDIRYYQRRNEVARLFATQRTCRRLRAAGIDLSAVHACPESL